MFAHARSATRRHHHTPFTSSMSRNFPRTVAAVIAALTFAAAAANAQTINLPDNDAPSGPFGKSSTATYGQTFVAPVGFTYLQSFSFWLSNDPGLQAVNPDALRFRAYVMEWDANNGHATGNPLFMSAVQSGPGALSQRYDFAPTNTLLNSTKQYVAFLSASGLFGSIGATEATAGVESSFAGTYTDGQFVFADNGDDFGALTTDAWLLSGGFPEYQAHFAASFTANAVAVVPEPSSMILLAAGMSAMLLVVVRRKRA